MKVGDKVKIIKDIPSVNGMLHSGTIVKIDEITEGKTLHVLPPSILPNAMTTGSR